MVRIRICFVGSIAMIYMATSFGNKLVEVIWIITLKKSSNRPQFVEFEEKEDEVELRN